MKKPNGFGLLAALLLVGCWEAPTPHPELASTFVESCVAESAVRSDCQAEAERHHAACLDLIQPTDQLKYNECIWKGGKLLAPVDPPTDLVVEPVSSKPQTATPQGEARWTALSADERVWVVATDRGELWRWTVEDLSPTRVDIPPEWVGWSGDISPDGSVLASLKLNTSGNPYVRTEKAAYVLRDDGSKEIEFLGGAREVLVSDKQLFAKGSKGVKVLDLESGLSVDLITVGDNLSPDFRYIVDDRGDSNRNRDHRKLPVHTFDTRKHLFDVGPGTTCAFSSNSSHIACLEYPADGEEIVVRTIPDGKRIGALTVHSPRDERVTDVSRDGRYVSTRRGIYDLDQKKMLAYSNDGIAKPHALLSGGRAVMFHGGQSIIRELAGMPTTDVPSRQ